MVLDWLFWSPSSSGTGVLDTDIVERDWRKNKEYLEGLSNNPRPKELPKISAIAKHGDWRNQIQAITILGEADKRDGLLAEIAENDGNENVRRRARQWLLERDKELFKQRVKDLNLSFGNTDGRLSQPVKAVIVAVDSDGMNQQVPRVGLSSTQIQNLGLHDHSEPMTEEDVKTYIEHRDRGWLTSSDFDDVIVKRQNKEHRATVYNASGPKAIGGPGIRVSARLAAQLRVKEKNRVYLRNSATE